MSAQPAFHAEVYQNQYLPAGGRVADAVVTVTGSGTAPRAGARSPSAAEVIMIDCSGSMAHPYTKLAAAKKATAAAIETLRDGVLFAVVAGRETAMTLYPPRSMTLARADPTTRGMAIASVQRLQASGGTAFGEWLTLTRQLFATTTAEFKHAIMLTDGENLESREKLVEVLRRCEGRFVCDSRGVGDDWIADELRVVASTLLGTADALENPADLPAAFRAMTDAAMGKAVADAWLRVWTPAGAHIRFVKQAYPHVEDLTGRRVDISPRIGAYPTGAWGTESRDYHVSVDLPPGAAGEEMLAARVSLVSNDEVLAQSLVLANWTDDTALSTKIHPKVAHYTGQAELADAIQEGLAAREAGDVDTATARLGRAVQLAAESGHEDTAKLLGRVVDVIDAPTGTVRLKARVSNVDAELASVRSVKTIRVKTS